MCTEEHDRLLTPKYQRSALRLRELPKGWRRGRGGGGGGRSSKRSLVLCLSIQWSVSALFDFGDAMSGRAGGGFHFEGAPTHARPVVTVDTVHTRGSTGNRVVINSRGEGGISHTLP